MPEIPGPYPADACIPALKAALAAHGRAILVAPPGSGKTTRVPLALLDDPGKVLVLEPRRLAARAAARFMARERGEEAGGLVGYRVRLDNRVSARTRVELLTEGILTRRLLSDPELKGVSCVIFDEFHERGLQADLGLALCLEAREILRPDLKLLVMSATLDVAPLRSLLGDCPVIETGGRVFPVDIRHAQGDQAFSRHVPDQRELTRKMAGAVRAMLAESEGGILAFLPGSGEIRRVMETLGAPPPGVTFHPLYGDLSPGQQDAAIAPAPPGRRKVVLATDLARTSLTLEGVRVVIDSGLARTSRFDPSTGMSRMVTERVTQDGADQRAGRAGRTEPGVCLRLWREGEQLLPHARPEIEEADLAPLLLHILAWGASAADLPWLTPPPQASLDTALQTLLSLEAAEIPENAPGGPRITPHGRELALLPLHPRLGHMVRRAGEHAALAACLAALVSERDPLRQEGPAPADIRLRLPLLSRPAQNHLLAAAEQIFRLGGSQGSFRPPRPDEEDFSAGLLSLAWPERIAQRRARGSFRLASGQGAELPLGDGLADTPYLAAASLAAPHRFGPAAGANLRLHLSAPLAEDDLYRLHGSRIRTVREVFWDSREQAAVSREVTRLDALVLKESSLPPGPALAPAVKRAVLEGIRALGPGCLPWTGDLRQWQARVLLLRHLDDPAQFSWPDVSDAALAAALAEPPDSPANWLAPRLDGVTRRAHFARIDLAAALAALLPWPLQRRLDEQAPERITVPSGNAVSIDYTPESGPVLAVKLQEMFGQPVTPAVAQNRCPLTLHLLSPAGRPLQITRDLAHFWANAYLQVRAEMRGRYPKHPWPDDPFTAIPTRKGKRHASGGQGR